MKKSHINILIITVIVLVIIIVSKFNILEILTERNIAVKILFFILTFAVAAFLIVPELKKRKIKNSFIANLKNLQKDEEFENIYSNISNNVESNLKKLKNKMLRNVLVFLVVNIILILVAIFCKLPVELEESSYAFWRLVIFSVKMFMFAITWLVFLFIIKKNVKEYHKTYKTDVIGAIVTSLRKGLVYELTDEEKAKIFKIHYKDSGFDSKGFNLFSAEDYVYGNTNEDVNIRLADICAKKIENKGKEDERVEVLFNGLFAASAIKNNINSTIKLLTDDFKLIIEDDFVKMDSSELEKNFDVYCFDKMLAMRIFTADTMEMLNKFYEKYKIAFEMIINNNIIYLRFHTNNMFETSVIGNPLNKEKLFLYYSVLKFVFEITENINAVLNDLSI